MKVKTFDFGVHETPRDALKALLDAGMPMLKSPPIAIRLSFAFALGAISMKMGAADVLDDLMDYLAGASDAEMIGLVADPEEDQ